MKKLALQILIPLLVLTFSSISYSEGKPAKVVVVGFSLNDMTGIPDAPEEFKRIDLLTKTFNDQLGNKGVEVVPMTERAKAEYKSHSPTYFYDNPATAVELNTETGADYILIGVALKPTYLFVYPRLLLVDTKTKKVVMSKAAQLESSWSDENTTVRTGKRLAEVVKERLDLLQGTK